jgi:4-amino-4-deoxy-L-arabinose transferase-like glycosyltransferase
MLCGTLLLLTAGLVAYSQTLAFSLDEGFHLLASQLINRGKTPYLDFCFPQPPLNAYWNAAWMHILGDSWHIPHLLAALLVAGAVMLLAEFIFSRFPMPRWRLPCALVGAFIVAVSVPIVQFGTVQAYGMCLFLTVAAFRVSVLIVDRGKLSYPFCAGLLAGAAAASSLLTAPVAPVLLVWCLIYNRTANRWIKSAAFLVGTVIPFAPVLWFFAKSPRVVFFNIIEYQLLYRRVHWEGATPHDFDVLTSWINSSQAIFIGALAIAGLLFVRSARDWAPRRRQEFFLSGWLALALTAYLALTHPTFERYFLLAVPFLAIPASVGFYAVASRLANPDRPLWPATLLIALLCLGLAKTLYDDRHSYKWQDYQRIAAKVEQVTPSNASLWADEVVYFLARHPPPPGMEFSYSHKLELPPSLAASLHIISQRELDRRIKAGAFSTIATCADDDRIDELGLARLYARKAEVSDCSVFWDRVRKPASPLSDRH